MRSNWASRWTRCALGTITGVPLIEKKGERLSVANRMRHQREKPPLLLMLLQTLLQLRRLVRHGRPNKTGTRRHLLPVPVAVVVVAPLPVLLPLVVEDLLLPRLRNNHNHISGSRRNTRRMLDDHDRRSFLFGSTTTATTVMTAAKLSVVRISRT